MLKKFGELFGQVPTRSRIERLADYDLTTRPFTRALLVRAATEADEGEKWLKDTVKSVRPIKAPENLNEKIASAITIAASAIVSDAMNEAIDQRVFLPGDPLPPETQLVVAFAYMVISGISDPLLNEGYTLDFKQACVDFVDTFFIMHSIEEKVRVLQLAGETFAQIGQVDMQNVSEWRSNVRQLAQFYVLQFTAKNEKFREQKFQPHFGSLLKSLLSAVE